MKLTIVNCSPKKDKGNTALVIRAFKRGFEKKSGICKIMLINEIDCEAAAKKLFMESEALLIAFPLYSGGMPAAGARLLRNWIGLKGRRPDLKVGFLTQYGVKEARAARGEELRLKAACVELNVDFAGMIIKGGVEGIRLYPFFIRKKLMRGFSRLGTYLAANGRFDQTALDKFSAPEILKKNERVTSGNRIKVAFANRFFWRAQLKRNGALKQYADKPLLNES